MQQVFINILLNALDAIPEENGHISISSNMRSGSINIEIKDNGKGMPESIINKIFDPLLTTKAAG